MNTFLYNYRLFCSLFFSFLLLQSCHTKETEAVPTVALTKEQSLQKNLDELKQTATSCDLITRLSDDIVSQQVTNLNEKDKRYSHCGLITERGNQKFVFHISPNLPGADTIEVEPLDSFVNPEKHIRCALFRYQLSDQEKNLVIKNIEAYKQQDVRFDLVYDLATNNKLYCSEMISKALHKATDSRMQFKEINAPVSMQKLLVMFFKKQHLTKEVIANRKFVSLDNLYLRPDCEELMHFNLKIFPGQ